MKLALVISLTFCSVLLASAKAPWRDIRDKILDKIDHEPVDLMIILDGSSLVTAPGFQDTRKVAKIMARMINKLNGIGFGFLKSQMGLVQFGNPSTPLLKFYIGQYDFYGILDAINEVTYEDGPNIAIGNGLRSARLQFAFHTPPSKKKMVWFATNNGHNNFGRDPIPQANALKNNGVVVCASAIGNNANRQLLRSIASNGCYFEFRNFDQYRDRMKKVKDNIS